MSASVVPFADEDDELEEALEAITTVGGGGLSVKAALEEDDELAVGTLVAAAVELGGAAERRAAWLARFSASATREGRSLPA